MSQEETSSLSGSPALTGLAGMHLLLVEDNEINQQLASYVLENAGAKVEVAMDGLAALAILEKRSGDFDAVLMDIKMPRMDGYEATRIIRGELKLSALPVIAMTANSRSADREKAVQAGMNAHVAKPIDVDELINTLRSLVAKAPQVDIRSVASPGNLADSVHEKILELPSSLPGIDLRTALIRLGGDRSRWFSLMGQFEASQGQTVDETRRLLDEGRDEEAARGMHSLRGVAANLGALDVARLAVEVETAVKDGPRTAVPALLEKLQDAMSAVFGLASQLPDGAARISETVS